MVAAAGAEKPAPEFTPASLGKRANNVWEKARRPERSCRKGSPAMRRHALAALAYLTLASPAFAQTAPTPPVGPDFAKINVVTVDLGHKTWMLEGAGGNVTVAAGDDGIIMVDGQFAPQHDKLTAAVAAE